MSQLSDLIYGELVFAELLLKLRPRQLVLVQHIQCQVHEALDVVAAGEPTPTAHVHRREHEVSGVAAVNLVAFVVSLFVAYFLAASEVDKTDLLGVLLAKQDILEF